MRYAAPGRPGLELSPAPLTLVATGRDVPVSTPTPLVDFKWVAGQLGGRGWAGLHQGWAKKLGGAVGGGGWAGLHLWWAGLGVGSRSASGVGRSAWGRGQGLEGSCGEGWV